MYLMSRYIKIYQDICYIYNYIVTGRAPSDKTKTTSKWESQLLNGCPHPFHTWLSHSETVSCFGLHKRILQRFRTAATDWTGKSKVTLSLPCPMAARYEYPLPPSPSSLSHNAWRHIGFGSCSWFAHGLAMEDAAWWKITLYIYVIYMSFLMEHDKALFVRQVWRVNVHERADHYIISSPLF